MSEQHLFKFQTENDYKTAKRNHLLLPNVSTVVETGNTYINSEFVPKELAEAGDIVVFHEENGEKIVRYMKPEYFDKEDGFWTADSIVVVPYSHTGDGTVRVMALNYASLQTPAEGGEAEEMVFGIGLTPEQLKQYGAFLSFSSIDGQTFEDTVGMSDDGILPSDAIDGELNPFDIETYYDSELAIGGNFLSSPYNNDETKNEAYHSMGDFSVFNNTPFTDMDGKANTQNIIKWLDTDTLQYSLYADTIQNNELGEADGQTFQMYPSAIACARYGSVLKPCVFNPSNSLEENLKTMPWYLPSAGEIGYYIARKARLEYALSQVGVNLTENDMEIATSTTMKRMLPSNEEIANPLPIPHPTDTDVYVVGASADGKMAYYNTKEKELCAIPFCKL